MDIIRRHITSAGSVTAMLTAMLLLCSAALSGCRDARQGETSSETVKVRVLEAGKTPVRSAKSYVGTARASKSVVLTAPFPAKVVAIEVSEGQKVRGGQLLARLESENVESTLAAAEATLLQAMENAGAEEMPEDAERKGLGTPATRAGIIEKLVRTGFLERTGNKKTKYLIPTQKGTALVTILPEQIQSASMTAEWEEKLLEIERGEYSADAFMGEIETMISDLVKNYQIVPDAEILMPKQKSQEIGKCPVCGNDVIEGAKGWFCVNRSCPFALWKQNRYFDSIRKKLTASVAEKLLANGKVRMRGCKSAKTGKTFDAVLILETDADGKARFRLDLREERNEQD